MGYTGENGADQVTWCCVQQESVKCFCCCLLLSSSGNKNITVTVPNAITEWKVGMFCTGRNGFGLAPTSSLLVFKPFLVELSLPSSVIKGETFLLKATVFNYLQRCMKVGEPCRLCKKSMVWVGTRWLKSMACDVYLVTTTISAVPSDPSDPGRVWSLPAEAMQRLCLQQLLMCQGS